MKIQIPDAKAPGFLKRQRNVQKYIGAKGVEQTDAFLDWLEDYIADDNPREVLLNASKDEIDTLIAAIEEAGQPDPKASENSGDG